MVTDELYHPIVYNMARSTIFITAYDRGLNTTAVHGLRHTYEDGRVLYYAEGHDMAQIMTPAFTEIVLRSVLWLAKKL